ncbi:hypothetical protein Dsin_022925 [Dipteronia sinensis]|uniref:RNase H type-1 domain-containing protein n=1 Tax=Dipteronia sinensis TaxID=43782 RepID=A0AAE0E078_9ROSI|nr:hypothetical protein Dsin_022925 [Dipteronia sinensis]
MQKLVADTIAWSYCPKGLYTVSCFRRCVKDYSAEEVSEFGKVWYGFSPPKVEGLCPNSKLGRAWITLFNAVAWSIWEVQNQAVFKGVPTERDVVIDLVRFRVAWWFKNHGRGSKEPLTVIMENLEICCLEEPPVKIRKSKKWIPPSDKALKFNVDAFVGSLDAPAAKLLAIHKACQLCVSKGKLVDKSINIESDSKAAVSWVEDGEFGNLALVNVIYDIRSMIYLHGNMSVSYVSRDLNLVADGLAKKGALLDGDNVVWSLD